MRSLLPRLALTALLACSAAANAAPVVLFSQLPFTTLDATGAVEVDGSYGVPLAQGFSAPAGSTLEQIIVWGARRPLNASEPDNFVLTLGAGSLGVLSVQTEVVDELTKYTIDVVDTLLTASTFSLINDVTAFEWYWANSTNIPYIDDDSYRAAFQLIGSLAVADVPEPGTLALLGVAGLGCALATRRRPLAA